MADAGAVVAICGVGLCLPPATRTLEAHVAALAAGGVVRPAPAGRDSLGAGRVAAWLDDVEGVDLAAMKLDEGTARWIDPAGRLLLRCARDALASAGLATTPAGVGLWVGLGDDGWSARTLHGGHAGAPGAGLGALPGLLATRIAYHLDLQGPAVAVDAACASALVAVAAAAEAVRAGTVPLALAGGATALVGADPDQWLRAIGALGTSDAPRPFAATGDGYVRGEGAGLVLLATESTARRLGLPILARVEGVGLAGGGRTNGIGAPSPGAHTRAAGAALATAGGPVGYVELGGLGQPLADRVELDGVGRAYVGRGAPVGTSRVVYGHLEHASGVVALATALATLRGGRVLTSPPRDLAPAPPGVTWAERDGALPADARVAVHGGGMNGTVVHLVLGPGEADAALAPPPVETLVRPTPFAAPAVATSPGSSLDRLGRVVQDVFNLPAPPSPDTPLVWQGLDSMGLVALRQRLEDEWGVALSQEVVSETGSLRELLARLEEPARPGASEVGRAFTVGVCVGALLTVLAWWLA